MKTVFAGAQVAHIWAQQTQPTGRNAGNSYWFEGPNLYSYRTLIARIHSPDVALVSSDSFSATTNGKHILHAMRALSGTVFRVPNLSEGPTAARENADYLERKYTDAIAEMMRSPATSYRLADTPDAAHPTRVHGTLNRMAAKIVDFRRTFDVAGPVLSPDESAAVIIARRDKLLNDPKRAAKREAATRAREVRLTARALTVFERNAERRADWRANVIGSSNYRLTDENGMAYLRLSRNGQSVETSLGAEVIRRDAVRVLAFYDTVRAQSEPRGIFLWERSPDNHSSNSVLGRFTLDAIYADGSIKAGCHKISAAEIANLKTLLKKLESSK